ncbi:hypothetical protein SKAU_G00064940 [Synaphobranchus kaupii]|uniref:Uncharacterized protein n=1 Tax=Synaphobranchus kaupii TaxID=118154 RepID=A0A9Q1J8Y7_SYNKA|nr:hypothetical protein SKAU_G00064940 [Synaphobranchus kaupii]
MEKADPPQLMTLLFQPPHHSKIPIPRRGRAAADTPPATPNSVLAPRPLHQACPTPRGPLHTRCHHLRLMPGGGGGLRTSCQTPAVLLDQGTVSGHGSPLGLSFPCPRLLPHSPQKRRIMGDRGVFVCPALTPGGGSRFLARRAELSSPLVTSHGMGDSWEWQRFAVARPTADHAPGQALADANPWTAQRTKKAVRILLRSIPSPTAQHTVAAASKGPLALAVLFLQGGEKRGVTISEVKEPGPPAGNASALKMVIISRPTMTARDWPPIRVTDIPANSIRGRHAGPAELEWRGGGSGWGGGAAVSPSPPPSADT